MGERLGTLDSRKNVKVRLRGAIAAHEEDEGCRSEAHRRAAVGFERPRDRGRLEGEEEASVLLSWLWNHCKGKLGESKRDDIFQVLTSTSLDMSFERIKRRFSGCKASDSTTRALLTRVCRGPLAVPSSANRASSSSEM